ncbi:hypothetical protein OIE82_25740 [Streptomyces althioticus]|uniref:DUF4034 domain-containing protein n=1 Tax=Streptomyces althioticus TaxID=83380 RepID=A0ABZ1Y9Y6_9ACTN|nr:hypothetical protein OG968_26405 [Streptomyces althioticus]WTB98490.1 hypothetical protein OHA53_09565 [Streptomyces althioticus]
MVDTMALLHAFTRTSRARGRRTGTPPPPAQATLPADDEVLLDAPDDALGRALVGAAAGDPAPAAELLVATRRRAAWEHRDRYVRRLAAFARSRPEWLDAWRARAPRDPDALLVDAQRAVDRVWDSPARAELLREVSPLITAAARADHRDPVPWRLALDHARGARAGHTYFEELWEAAVRRAPHHHGCHVAALRYLASSWHGSHRECLDFAETAAQDAPEGSLTQALPLRAAFGYLTDGCGPAVERARLDAAADRAAALSARLPPAQPWPAELRNLLAHVLVRLGRRRDALEQFRLTGPYATSFPWDRDADDPLGRFLEVRQDVLLAVASGSESTGTDASGARSGRPGSERRGRPEPRDH